MKHYTPTILTLYFLRETRNDHNPTSREIHNAMTKAKAWFDNKIPLEKLDKIKLEHGFTPEQWEQVLMASGSFYFIPTKEMDACNKAIQEFLKGFIFINHPDYLPNYTASQLEHQVHAKFPKLTREKLKDNLWHYSLTTEAYNEITKNLKP